MSVSPAPPLILASTSPQRRAILEQLAIPFAVVAPRYDETGDDPVEHAAGKARSVEGGDRPVLGVDTIVVCHGDVLAAYVAAGEWEGRAGAYAIQGLGGGLVERIEGDYLNVVGLPAALLVRLLATRFPGLYGFG